MLLKDLMNSTNEMLHIYSIKDMYKATPDKELGAIWRSMDKRKADYRKYGNREVILFRMLLRENSTRPILIVYI